MPIYVIRAEELILLNDMPADHPRPVCLEWINRGTDQKLRPTSVDLLLRTMYRSTSPSPSVARLHQTAGLRVRFGSNADRDRFATTLKRLPQADRLRPKD